MSADGEEITEVTNVVDVTEIIEEVEEIIEITEVAEVTEVTELTETLDTVENESKNEQIIPEGENVADTINLTATVDINSVNDIANVDDADEVEKQWILSFKGKKKKKKKAVPTVSSESKDSKDSNLTEEKDYTYMELLTRLYSLLHEDRPVLAKRAGSGDNHSQKKKLPPVIVVRIGTKRVGWKNFAQYCTILHRQEDHLMKFILSEFGTTGSLDANKILIVKGNRKSKDFEALITKYVTMYVSCKQCRDWDTSLTRDPQTRLWFVECENCKTRHSVEGIKTGFHAQTRADRKK